MKLADLRPYRDRALAWAKANRSTVVIGLVIMVGAISILITNAQALIHDQRVREATQTCLRQGKTVFDRQKAAKTQQEIDAAMKFETYVLHECNIAVGREKP